jgi:hypothetical protein
MEWTVQDLIDSDMAIEAYCKRPRCGHWPVDPEKLKAKLGPSAPAMAVDILRHLVCPKCGGSSITLIYAPGGKDRMPSNPTKSQR